MFRYSFRQTVAILFSLSGLLLAPMGCDQQPSTSESAEGKRIVTVSPAITQMIVDLERADLIVGVMQHDPIRERRDVAVVGDLYNLDYEKLLFLRPTHIFLQQTRDGVPQKLRELADRHDWKVLTYRIDTIADVQEALWDPDAVDPTRSVGGAIGYPMAAQVLSQELSNQLRMLAELTLTEPTVRTLLLIGRQPPTAAGPGTFLDEMLSFAGGANVLDESAGMYPTLDREQLLRLEPDVVVIVNASTAGGAAGGAVATTQSAESLPDVGEARVVELRHPLALLPSTSMPTIAAELTKLLHPEISEEVDAVMEEASSDRP